MKKIVALVLALVLALAAVSSFAEELPEFRKKMSAPDDVETIIANAISNPQRVKEQYAFEEGCVAIPVILSFQTLFSEKAQVCGNFMVEVYKRNGDTLEYVSGGSNIGIITLEKGENGWTITGEEYAGDGEAYEADLERFANGDPELLRQFRNAGSDESWINSVRWSFLNDYLDQIHMNGAINYYRLPGGEPVSLN